MNLTRVQILKKFDLRPRTLEVLLGTGQLNGTFKSRQGKRVLTLSKKDVFVLECAKNSIYSFGTGSVSKGRSRGVRALPFHRFLCLRFITYKVDEVYDEILQNKILRSSVQFPVKELKAIHKRFLSRCPQVMRKFVQKNTYPKKKADIAKFDLMLKAMDIHVFYHHPEFIDELFFYFRMKEELEALLTTNSGSGEVAFYIEKLLGLKVGMEAISSYRRMFYSIHDLEQEDIDLYFSIIPPSDRKTKREALGKTLSELSVMKGVSELVETREILEIIKREAIKDYFDSKNFRTTQSMQAMRASLDQFLKVEERLERLGGPVSEISMIFERFIVRQKSHGDIISIDEIREKKIADDR